MFITMLLVDMSSYNLINMLKYMATLFLSNKYFSVYRRYKLECLVDIETPTRPLPSETPMSLIYQNKAP